MTGVFTTAGGGAERDAATAAAAASTDGWELMAGVVAAWTVETQRERTRSVY